MYMYVCIYIYIYIYTYQDLMEKANAELDECRKKEEAELKL